MHLLVIHDEKTLFNDFQQIIGKRIEAITVNAVDWRQLSGNAAVDKLLARYKPRMVLFLATLDVGSNKKQRKQFCDVVENMATVLANHHLPLVFISSAAVFSGEQLNYDESCDLSPETLIGQDYQQMEALIQAKSGKALIIRTSWLFSPAGDNFLTQVISHASKQKIISVNSAGKGCPTATADFARVLVAICLQLDLDIDVWGVYHYCSSDASIGFQFVEALLSQAVQYDDAIDAKNVLFEHNDTEKKLFFFEPVVLNCQKLLDTFGVHQKPWRSMIGDAVKTYYQLDK